MHDYSARLFHDDRIGELTREANAFRLAALAKKGQPRRHPRALLRRLSFRLYRLSLEAWRSRSTAYATGPESGGTTALSVSSAGDR